MAFAAIGKIFGGAARETEAATGAAGHTAAHAGKGAQGADAAHLGKDGVGHGPKGAGTYSPEALKAANGGKKFDAAAMKAQRTEVENVGRIRSKAQSQVNSLKQEIETGKLSPEDLALKQKELATAEAKLTAANKTFADESAKLTGMQKSRTKGAVFADNQDKVNMGVGLGSMGMMLPMMLPMLKGSGSSSSSGSDGSGADTTGGTSADAAAAGDYGSLPYTRLDSAPSLQSSLY